VRECPTCERVYERFAAAESALYPRTPERTVGTGQIDRVARRLFAEGSASTSDRARTPRWGAAAALAAAAAVALWVAGPAGEPARDSLRSRQGSVTAVAPDVGLRVLRIRERDGADDLLVDDMGTGGTARPGDRLAALVTNTGDLDRVVLERVTPEGTRTTVVEMTDIRRNIEDMRLGTVRVGRDWSRGVHVFRARFIGSKDRREVREVRIEVAKP